MTTVRRAYKITFNSRPSIQQVVDELQIAARVFHEWTRIAITTTSSTDPELEEVTIAMVRDE